MPKMVKLASGKTAEVGTTFNKGGFSYRVQADGSVKSSNGRTTAKPTSITVEVSPRTMPKKPERPPQRQKAEPPIPITRSAAKSVNSVRPAGPVSSNKAKATVNAVRPAGPVSSNVAKAQAPAKKTVDVAKQYGNSSTRKVDVGQMYGSRPVTADQKRAAAEAEAKKATAPKAAKKASVEAGRYRLPKVNIGMTKQRG